MVKKKSLKPTSDKFSSPEQNITPVLAKASEAVTEDIAGAVNHSSHLSAQDNEERKSIERDQRQDAMDPIRDEDTNKEETKVLIDSNAINDEKESPKVQTESTHAQKPILDDTQLEEPNTDQCLKQKVLSTAEHDLTNGVVSSFSEEDDEAYARLLQKQEEELAAASDYNFVDFTSFSKKSSENNDWEEVKRKRSGKKILVSTVDDQ